MLPPSTLGARIDTFDFRDAIGAIGHPIINSYDVKIEWIGCTPDAVTIDSLLLRTIFQLNPNVLPALRGRKLKTIHIASEDGRPLDGLLYIHEYKALSGYDFPGVVTYPRIFPPDGAGVEGSEFEFEWEPPTGFNIERIGDYHVQVSTRSDFRFPVSSAFNKHISTTPSAKKARWRIPTPGCLHPGEPYYWRVAVRSVDGDCSAWSTPWTFTINAPSVPIKPQIMRDADSLFVVWENDGSGTLL